MITEILNLTSIFKLQKKNNLPAKYDLPCVQFADLAGKIAAGALIQTNTIPFGTFFILLVKDCFI
jgi:hypothetical protein